jgi:autotransporter-associated beta strand protein
MHRRSKQYAFLAAAIAASSPVAFGAAFQAPTDLLLLQRNKDGGSAQSADSVTIKEYNPSAGFTTPVNAFNLPTNTLSYNGTSGLGLTLPDTSDHDGQLTLSQDGHDLVFATYLSNIGGIDYFGTDVAPNAVPASMVPRVIDVMHPDGTLDDSTQLSGPNDYAAVSIRQITSLNGTQFWSIGNGDKPYGGDGVQDLGGLRYCTLGGSATTSLNIGNGIDARTTTIFQGQLYVSGGSNNSPPGQHTLSQLGTGIPTSSPPAWNPPHAVGAFNAGGTILGNQSPQFLTLNDGNIVLYQSDSTTGALEKYTLTNGIWNFDGRIAYGKDNIENVAARVNGSSITIYVDNPTGLYQFTDTGGAGIMNLTGLTNIAQPGQPSAYPTLPAPILSSPNGGFSGISFAPSTSAAVGNQIWANPSGGAWNVSANWADGIPNASGATATFGPNAPGLAANGIVSLPSGEEVGHVVLNNSAASYTIGSNSGGTLTIDNTDSNASGVPSVYDEGGTQTIAAPVSLAAGVTLSAAYNSALTLSGPISGSGGINVYGLGVPGVGVTQQMLGVVTISGANSYGGTTSVNSGTLVVAGAGSLPAGGAVVNNALLQVNAENTSGPISGTGTLSIGNGFTATLHIAANSGLSQQSALAIAPNAALDIENNHFVINYGSAADPISTIVQYLASGYNAGHWNGPGINSNTAAANSLSYGLGYADSADAGNPAGLASGTIEIAYTLLGDANLDHAVNGVDFGILAANFNKGITGWDKGDFNYDNAVNGVDFGLLAANFNKGASGADAGASKADYAALDQFAAANGLLADVPEPTSVALLALGASALLARRHRR